MPNPREPDSLIQLLTRYQSRLYAFIYSLLPDPELAADVLQETSLVLWRKAESYDTARGFLPWALAIARNQVLAARLKASRNRLVFDQEVVERLASRASARLQRSEDRQVALANCLGRLPEHQRSLAEMRYRQGSSIAQIAKALGRTANAMAVAFHRLRQTLARCIESRLQEAPNSR